MQRTPEKFKQLNLLKLNTPTPTQSKQTKLNFKTNDLKVSQSKPTFYGVTCAVTPLYSGGVFFSAELGQVDSVHLQVLTAY